MIFPVLAGLGALAACMSNPRRRRNPKGLIGVAPDGTRYSTKKNYNTGEWMIVAYVKGKRHEGRTLYFDDKQDAIDTFHFLMKSTKTNPRTTVKRYCGDLTITLGVDENKSMPPRGNYFGRVSGSGVDYPFHDLSILLPSGAGIDAPVAFDKAAEAALQFASNDVGDEVFGQAEDDPATAERETTFVIQRKKGGTKFYPARRTNPRRGRHAKARMKTKRRGKRSSWRTVTVVTNSRVTKRMKLNPQARWWGAYKARSGAWSVQRVESHDALVHAEKEGWDIVLGDTRDDAVKALAREAKLRGVELAQRTNPKRRSGELFLIEFLDPHGRVVGHLTPKQFMEGIEAPSRAFLEEGVERFNKLHRGTTARIILKNPDSRTAVTQRLPVIRHTIRLPREYDPRTATTQRLKAIKTNPRRRRSC